MKKLLLLALLIPAGSALGYTFTVHNTTDTDMDVTLHQALTPSKAPITVKAGAVENIETTTPGTCTRSLEVIGSGSGSANGLTDTYNFGGMFGHCGGNTVYIRHIAAQPTKGGVNINVGGSQTTPQVGAGKLEISVQ